MKNNIFAIVTVVNKDLKGLKATRKSLNSQIYENWMHIIIDSKKDSDLFKYIKSLPKKNTIYISERDTGIYNAMNKGWKIAPNASYIYFLNARDTFASESSLKEANRALNILGNPEWGVTTHEEIAPDGSSWVCKLVAPPSLHNQLYAFGYRSHQAAVMKKEFIVELGGFDESYKLAADWDLIARAYMKISPGEWVYPLAKFELGGESSKKGLESHMELKDIRRKFISNNFFHRILDDFWCAIYLRYFNYQNYFSPLVNLLLPQTKRRNQTSQRIKMFRSSIIFEFGKFQIEIRSKQRRKKIQQEFIRRWRFNRSFRFMVITLLHKSLRIQPYAPPTLSNLSKS